MLRPSTIEPIYTCAPFEDASRIRGLGLENVRRAFAGVTLPDVADRIETLRVTRDIATRTDVQMGWGEKRPDGRPGRCFSINATIGHAGGGVDSGVVIAGCYANTTTNQKGLARAARRFAAIVAVSLNAPITGSASEDGVHVWLILDAQPDEDDLQTALHRLRHQNAAPELVAAAKARDFVGLRQRDERGFAIVAEALRPWSGGWSVEQARAIAAEANEGLR